MPEERAVVFIDGSNWYHGLKGVGMANTFGLNYAKISEKLSGSARKWIGTRYYVGRLESTSPSYADQRRLESFLTSTDSRITMHLVESNPMSLRTRPRRRC